MSAANQLIAHRWLRPFVDLLKQGMSPEKIALTLALGAVLGRPACAPLPAVVVKAMFGEMGERLLLEGAYVRPSRLESLGFRWALGDLEHAFRFETGNIA